MKNKIVMGIVMIGCILVPFLSGTTGINASTNQRGTTGNIVRENLKGGYFTTTELRIEIANLTTNRNYGLLIGANQNITDQQWQNFTASKSNVLVKTTHFLDQSTQLNVSGVLMPINQLLLNLYGILNDEDTEPILLDQYWLKIKHFGEQIPEEAIPIILSVLIIMGAFTGIFLTVFKYIKG